MMPKPRYAGIGSRYTPSDILNKMAEYASKLEKIGFILRSGGTKGADKAFEKGVLAPSNKEIYTAYDCQPWALEMVKNYLPDDRQGFDNWKPYIKKLVGRDMMQILGRNKELPVRFVICWTPVVHYNTSECGGTGYALRLAIDKNIPIFNLLDTEQIQKFEELLEFLEK